MSRVTGLARKRAEYFQGKGAAIECPNGVCGAVVGGCGCSGGRVGATSTGVPLGNGFSPNGLGFTANPNGVPPGTPGFDMGPMSSDDWWANFRLASPCFPAGYTEARWRKVIAQLRNEDLAGRRAPYCNPALDYMELDTLYSDITTIAPGVTANINVQPEAGQFLVAYYRIIARTAIDGLQQVDYTTRKPRISGCPVPCDNLDRNIMSQFTTNTIETCPCGIPLLAWIQRQGEVIPLQVPVTNGAAVDLTFQVEVRGFCCDQRICL